MGEADAEEEAAIRRYRRARNRQLRRLRAGRVAPGIALSAAQVLVLIWSGFDRAPVAALATAVFCLGITGLVALCPDGWRPSRSSASGRETPTEATEPLRG